MDSLIFRGPKLASHDISSNIFGGFDRLRVLLESEIGGDKLCFTRILGKQDVAEINFAQVLNF